jgi:D-serine deaminase-like pyridoxal phosphate-dependent protein
VIIDAGAIALSKDRGPVGINPGCGYGKVLDLDGKDLNLTVSEMSQEHGVIIANDEKTFDRLRVGSRVRFLANHSCLTAAQHSHYNVLEGENIVDRWQIHTAGTPKGRYDAVLRTSSIT